MFIIHIAGHLGKDPETRFTPSGQKITTFNVATNLRKGKEDVTVWVRVVIWNDRFDKLMPYLKKGSAVFVSGKLNPPSSYTDKEGRTQINLEVVAEMIDFSPFGKSDRQNEGTYQSSATHSQSAGQAVHENNYGSHYEESSFQGHPTQYGKSAPNYASQNGHGNSSYSQSIDEDALPF